MAGKPNLNFLAHCPMPQSQFDTRIKAIFSLAEMLTPLFFTYEMNY
ncbi:hypothetical protein TSAR_008400 [Trichomalopsis sarcophagae]|uniref:Uncharacterized protein n=1 Tax=Trichomalopsis sarcophagae TaxID=543379 RepID=A0A232FH23_9HYME|nr:hypothetical protein TSAR_008400 [Trichomalopsis sarcophagae]